VNGFRVRQEDDDLFLARDMIAVLPPQTLALELHWLSVTLSHRLYSSRYSSANDDVSSTGVITNKQKLKAQINRERKPPQMRISTHGWRAWWRAIFGVSTNV